MAPAQALKLDPEGPQPIELSAERLSSELDRRTVAEGEVRLTQGPLRLSTDWLELRHPEQLATARGHVVLRQGGNELRGSEASVRLDTRAGHVQAPSFLLERTGGRGWAEGADFVGSDRLNAQGASYTSCRVDDPDSADWVLHADRLDLDFEHNEGRAEGAVLRFLGVPILAAPVLSFPATGERKSGWLPPTIYPFDSRNGFQTELPYYFNLAPDHDLTLTPGVLLRRGASLGAEYRYLLDQGEGSLAGHWLPNDRLTGRDRYSLRFKHEGEDGGLRYGAAIEQASDDDYWKDFSRQLVSPTRRLLSQNLQASREWALDGVGLFEGYARVQGWRTLQVSDAVILPPFQRLPQLGLRGEGALPQGLNWSLQGEFNRFMLRNTVAADTRFGGERVHLLGALSHTTDPGWGWITPRLSFNAAAYQTDQAMSDGRTRASRTIPTISLDSGLRFERSEEWLGRSLHQTLEPRLHYVRTPWRPQDALPNFDAAVVDFNELSIYGDNAFSGVDFVTDVHQVTLGATSRWFDAKQGAELLRLGVAQRYLFSDQRITTERLGAGGLAPESGAAAARFSDLLLFGATTLVPHWLLETKLQYNADISRTTRSIVSARWQPAPFHTLSATYRYTRGLNEQVELGWQWPVYRGEDRSDGRCTGSLYGVGRVNYGLPERRITDAIAGLEYDAGCWIGRVVAERVSTGQTEATTRLMIQLELVGLSRLGPNPLKVLKDNIPGYQLLRDDAAPSPIAP